MRNPFVYTLKIIVTYDLVFLLQRMLQYGFAITSTPAATWVSAAVGLACGGGLYFTAIFATCLNLVLLRFGPRATGYDSESGMTGYGSGDLNNITGEMAGLLGSSRDVDPDAKGGANYPSYHGKEQENSKLSSRQLSMGSTRSRQSIRRNKPSLLAV